MVRTAIQLFTLKDVSEPIPDVVARVGETAFDGVEFYDAHFDAFEDDSTVRETAAALEGADLEVAGAHVGIERIEESVDDLVEICHEVGCSQLVIPTYDSEAFGSLEGVRAAAERIDGLAADLADEGIDLLYHNHTFEFDDVGGDVAFEAFVAHTDAVAFEPDVGLATHAGYDAGRLLEVTAGRAPVVHLTDTVPDDSHKLHADVGEGVLDVEGCAEAAVEHGAEWLVCENGRTDDGLASLAHGSEAFARLRERVEEAE